MAVILIFGCGLLSSSTSGFLESTSLREKCSQKIVN